MNATMRRIDLFCKLAGPLFVSLLTIDSASFTALFLTAANVISLPFEYFFILIVHNRFPNLAIKSSQQRHVSQPFLQRIFEWPQRTLHSWKTYYHSPLFAASFALSILYFTVLSFGGILCSVISHSRFDDCLFLPVFRLFDSSHSRAPSICRGYGDSSNIRFPTDNPLGRSN